MKRFTVKILAVLLVLCMILPQSAMAATMYYIEVSISGPNLQGEEKPVSASSSQYGVLSDRLSATVVALLNEKYDEIQQTYKDTGFKKIVNEGLNAFDTVDDGTAWSNYIDQYDSGIAGPFKEILKNKRSTFGDLQLNQDNQVTYTTEGGQVYTVTVTLRGWTIGGDTPTDTTTETTQNPDGSVTTITKDQSTGTVTTTNKLQNGVTGTTVTDKDGNITDISVNIPASAAAEAEKTGGAITLPAAIPVVTDGKDAPAVKVVLPSGVDSVKVGVPTQKVGPGMVAVIVDENGEETIMPKSVVTEQGVKLELSGSTELKIVDNSKAFTDVPSGFWGEDAVAFTSARNLFLGVGDTEFAPQSTMTRGMLATVLYRLESEPDANIQNMFHDVQENAYYTDGVNWAAENGVVKGYGDGTYKPEQIISRQELVVMLYRNAKEPAVEDGALDFPDAEDIHGYAKAAMRWAVDNGIIVGMDGKLNPEGWATRAQVAAVLMRFCDYLMNQ